MTFAELEYLLAEDETWAATRRRIGLAEPPADGAVAAAGLASLIVRKLAALDGAAVGLDESITAAALLLARPQVWLELACTRDSTTLGAYVGLPRTGPVTMLSLAAPGVFEISAFAAEPDCVSTVVAMLAGLVESSDRLFLSCRELPDAHLQIERHSDGTYHQSEHVGGAVTATDPVAVHARVASLAQSALRHLSERGS